MEKLNAPMRGRAFLACPVPLPAAVPPAQAIAAAVAVVAAHNTAVVASVAGATKHQEDMHALS